MVECPVTKKRFRPDQIEPQLGTVYTYNCQRLFPIANSGEAQPAEIIDEKFEVLALTGKKESDARKTAEKYFKDKYRPHESVIVTPILVEGGERKLDAPSIDFNPENGAKLGPQKVFNLMLKTYVGATQDESSITYLRPETAQAMFVQFKNVLDTTQKKLPFGIAQIGKAFRNEINPRNFTFRSREFEQMEVEFFVKPGTGPEWLDKWLEERLAWYESIGIPRAKIHVLTVPEKDRAFYSQGTYDLEYEFPFGVQELEGIAHRGNYDLTQHAKASGKPLEYFDEEAKLKYLPEVVEPSAGVDRTVLALLCEAFEEETIKDDESGKEEVRTVLRFAPRMAPIKAAIFPLLKNKPELVAKAREIYAALQPLMKVAYADTAAIGRRYRRFDEIGTPYGITVDFETLEGVKEASISATGTAIAAGEKDTVTLRERDSMKQQRIVIGDLFAWLLAKVV
jgi:glycyl-tRNA synthetase